MDWSTPGASSRGLREVFGAGPVSGLSDLELLDRFRRRPGDSASFEAIVARHGAMVLGVCRDLLGDSHLADDAFQATFLVLVQKAGGVRLGAGDSLGRWLYGVAWRVAKHARADRARQRRKAVEADLAGDAVSEKPSPAEALERDDVRALLHEELNRLPGPYRSALVLCHLDGLSHEEAARQLCWPVGTVRSRLARGRERLRGRLLRRGVAPAAAVAALEASTPASAAVPAALAAETVRAVAAYSGAAGVVSSSVIMLMRGFLMATTVAQMKFVACCLAGTVLALSATAVMAWQEASRPAGAKPEEAAPAAKAATPAPTPAPVQATPPVAGADPFAGSRLDGGASAALRAGSRRDLMGDDPNAENTSLSPSPAELLVRFNAARAVAAQTQSLFQRGVVSSLEVSRAQAEQEIVQARLATLAERLRDELELLEVRLQKGEAGVKRAEAEYELAAAIVARNVRLNDRIKGSISPEEIRVAQSRLRVAEGERDSARADVLDATTRIAQVKRRLKAAQDAVERAKRPA
ncbi:MAG: sigma-70 family RNA polymerase sigma factor [Isosphaeraceae bacterium]